MGKGTRQLRNTPRGMEEGGGLSKGGASGRGTLRRDNRKVKWGIEHN